MYQRRHCIITGAANGIGRCMAERFLQQGALLSLIDLDGGRLEELADAHPRRVWQMQGDVGERETLERFVEGALSRFGPVFCLINNACATSGGILSGCGYEAFVHTLRVGAAAPYYLCSLLRDHFAPDACVVNISSTRARQSMADTESYTAAKGAVSALTHALSASLAGIARVNAVSPGWIETAAYQQGAEAPTHSPADRAQHPAGRVGKPEDVAALVEFLCGDAAGFLTGQDIALDGGMSRLMIYHGERGWTCRPPDETRT